MKKLLPLLLACLFIPSFAGAQVANVPWARLGSQQKAYWPYFSDKLGVGTSSPTAPLHVYSTGDTPSQILMETAAGQAGFEIAATAGSGRDFQFYNNYGHFIITNKTDNRVGFQLRGDSGDMYLVQDGGAVTIGTSTVPAAASTLNNEKLFVQGDTGVSNYFYVGPFAYDGISEGLEGTFDPEYFIADFTAVEGTNHYAAVSLNNFNVGTSSSIDLTFNNASTSDVDGDGEFSYYGNIGFNSPNYNTPFYGYQNVPNMLYMYSKDGPLSFASVSPTSTISYIQFLTGANWGSEAARITSTGAFGIGSTSPQARLVVTNPLSTQTAIFEDQANDTTPVVIDASGNVAIGSTTVPTGRLAVSCSSNSTGTCIYAKNSSNFDVFRVDDTGRAIFGREAAQLTATPVYISTGGTYGNGAPGSTTNCKYRLYYDGNASSAHCIGMSAALFEIRAGASGGIGMYPNNGTFSTMFASSGFVGIGTTTPATYLHVSGADTASRMQASIQSTGANVGLSFYDSTLTRVGYLYTTASVMTLSRTSRAFSIDNQFYITSAGIVGIGTTTPAGGLTVANGNIRNYATDATMLLQHTSNANFAGVNMHNESGTLIGSFQIAGSNTGVPALNGNFFLGPRNTSNSLLFTQGTASTIAGGYDSSRTFFWGTSTQPVASSKFTVFDTATSTFAVDSSDTGRGGCFAIKDSDGSGYTYVTAANGVLTASTVSCK